LSANIIDDSCIEIFRQTVKVKIHERKACTGDGIGAAKFDASALAVL